MEPVTTKAADTFRRQGMRVLSERYLVLLQRAARRRLSRSEERERRETELALEQLQLMAPVGPLLSRKGGTWMLEGEDSEELSA